MKQGWQGQTVHKICRGNHIHYTSLRLLFSIIIHLSMSTCSCYPSSVLDLHWGENVSDGLRQSVLIQSHYYWLLLHPMHIATRKAMYSGCDYPYKSCVFCHPYFILKFCSIIFILVSVLFFIALSVIHLYHLTWFAHSINSQ